MKHIVSTAVILLLIGGGTYFFLLAPKKAVSNDMACLSRHMKIAAFGDSLVEGYGATGGNDFPTLLGAKLGVPIANFGHSGDTTASAFARIDSVIDAKPDVVIVLLGGNDALQRVPLATTKENLSMIIEKFQQANIKVVLVGVMGGIGSDPYKGMFEGLAKTYRIALVPNVLSGIFGDRTYMSDQVHPNDAGYAKVAAKILPAVQGACE